MAIADDQAAAFPRDVWELKVNSLKEIAAKLKDNSFTPEQRIQVALAAMELAERAAAEEQFGPALEIGRMAGAAARPVGNTELKTELRRREIRLQSMQGSWELAQKARERLKSDPENPRDHQAVGTYLCLVRGEWDAGLPHLAKGDHPDWKPAAVKDMAGLNSPQAQVAVADLWWEAGQRGRGGERDHLLARAHHWYCRAVAAVTGLTRARVEARLREIERTPGAWQARAPEAAQAEDLGVFSRPPPASVRVGGPEP
jgi:hypothetical protein